MALWLDTFEQIPNRLARGGAYVGGPWRFVWHTTEVVPSGTTAARSMAERHDTPPHLWVWPERRWKAQTVTLDRAAFALRRPKAPLSPPTNGQHAIQVEIIGRASESLRWPEGWLDWLGTEVLAPVVYLLRLAHPEAVNLDRVGETDGPFGYGTDGTVRMDWDEWADFDGVCGHANVPGNDHWDPGHADLRRIAEAAKHALAPTKPPTEEDLLMAVALNDHDARDAFVRTECERYWGRPPASVEELNLLIWVLATEGAAKVIASIEAHDRTKELRHRRGW